MAREGNRPRRRGLVAALAVIVMVAGACSSGDETSEATGGDDDEATTVTERPPSPPSRDDVAVPTLEGPITGGEGDIRLGPGGFDLTSVGYVEEEYFLSGTATAYTADAPLASDGEWSVEPDTTEPYTTRVVVRRPAGETAFNGTVVVEWLNVSGGLDADAGYKYMQRELIRSGYAWVGVSAQRAGIEGGESVVGISLALKSLDPVRYEPLAHPGDDHSYDLFSQVGAALWFEGDTLLGGMVPQRVLAVGESQSGSRLTTYINAVAPLVDVYDGYFLHSRSERGASLATEPRQPIEAPTPTYLRNDASAPVLVFSTESDLVGDRLGYARARQSDSDTFRSWEVAGTAHGDAYGLGISDRDDGSGVGDTELFEAMLDPPSSIYGGAIECDLPINTGPQTYVVRAAVDALDRWVRTGEAPPSMPRIELDESGDDFVRDDAGIVRGGIRTPQVDVPVAVLSGLGQTGQTFCSLFGTTGPLDATYAGYDDHESFVRWWDAAVDRAVETGAILPADGEVLKEVAAASSVGR
jgi:hypothetical protein